MKIATRPAPAAAGKNKKMAVWVKRLNHLRHYTTGDCRRHIIDLGKLRDIRSDIMISVNFQLNYQWASVHSNSCSSNGLKSRPESCPYSPVAQGNGVLVTEGREFPIGKTAGRNEREPISSLVKIREDADPVDVRGRPKPDRLENGSVCQDLPG